MVTGNTMVLNATAMELLRSAPVPRDVFAHDWWTYLIVMAAGGELIYEADPTIKYRQHGGNQLGENVSLRAKLRRIRGVAQGQFKGWIDSNVIGLQAVSGLLSGENAKTLALFQQSRRCPFPFSLLALMKSGVYRQQASGTLAVYIAALLGKL
jgi:hypothetical protein